MPQLTSWRRPTIPWRTATRAKGMPDDPAIRVLSRSKKAAARLAGNLDHDRVALAAAAADRGDAEAASPAAELVDERADDAGAGGADRVPEGDRAAVDVDVLLAHAQHPHRVEGDGGEGLVDLPEV